jgi:drug/metabolite transporter (DMT)-like permease
MAYFYIAGCVFFTVYGQVILKWRIDKYGALPDGLVQKFATLAKLIFLDPFILSGFASAFIASFFWMSAISKLPLSYAYPFMSSAFLLVVLLSVFFFGETLNIWKIVGTLLVVLGLILLSRGYT